MNPAPLTIRPSAAADLAAITVIYADAGRHGTSSFQIDSPDEAGISRRRDAVLAQGLPWLMAENAGRVIGCAYAGTFRPRPAYRFSVEDSVYQDRDSKGRGAGRALLAELITRCEMAGARQMLAVIGDSANSGSIGVHRALGFEHCGQLTAVGWKFGRRLDVVLMERALGRGRSAAADAA
jgi:L-amino acid N-acyltransferase YncA